MNPMTRVAPRRLRPWLILLASRPPFRSPPTRLGAVVARSPDRSRPPKLANRPALRLPAIQKTTLSNGVPVWIIEQHRVPLVQVNVILRGGSSLDRAGRFGMASLVAGMLDEGAGSRSSLELADAVDLLGADLSTSSSFDYSAVRLSTPAQNLAAAMPLLADVVLRPTFPDAELERLKKERLTALVQAQDDPAAVIGYAFPRVVFGPAHRYGTPAGGLAPAIQAITADEARSFYKEHYVSGHATIVVVGDVTPGGVKAELERAFGGWPGSGPRDRRGGDASGDAADEARDRARRQAGSGAVADSHRPGRRAALDAGLCDARGAEHHPRRLVHVATEPEPAREERLHLWRRLGVRHADLGGSVLRHGGRADRQDRRRAARVLRRARQHH